MNSKTFLAAHKHITQIMPLIKHAAEGQFRYPYLSVTYGQHYGGSIFSWDNHHMTLRFAACGETSRCGIWVR